MRLNNYLNEIFDTKVKLKITKASKETFTAKFSIGKIDYRFDAEFLVSFLKKQYWDITFRRLGGAVFQSPFNVVGNLESKEVLTVFSAVKTAMLMFLKKYKPKTFLFSAKETESSRVKLYDNFAKIIIAKTGYKLERKSDLPMAGDPQITYVFTRK